MNILEFLYGLLIVFLIFVASYVLIYYVFIKDYNKVDSSFQKFILNCNLHLAVEKGDLATVKRLIKHSNILHNKELLKLAFKKGYLDIVQFLIDKNC